MLVHFHEPKSKQNVYSIFDDDDEDDDDGMYSKRLW